MTKKQLLLLLLIIGIGAFFRFYLIKQMPGGLFPDEAANGLDVNNILKGHIEPFYPRGNGREALFFYMLAASVQIFGRGFWQHHIVSALIGTITILGVYLLGARLADRKTGLLAAFLMAVNTWQIVLSRTAFRAILSPLFVAFTFYFGIRALQAKSKRDQTWSSIFFGAFLAGGLYTYINFRMVGAILVVLMLFILLIDWRQKFAWVKAYFRRALIALVSFAVVIAPLAYYWATNPGSFAGRAGQVSIFNPDLNHGSALGTGLDVLKKTVLGFFTQGDLNWRQNISGQPFLSPLVSPFFGLALLAITLLAAYFIIQVLRNKQNNAHLKYLLLAGLFWGMAVPELLTAEGIPHGLRLIGVAPAVFIMTAMAIMYVVRKALLLPHHRWMESLYAFVALAFFATLIISSYTQYFVLAYQTPENFQAFRSDLSSVSVWLNQHPDKEHNLLVLDLFSAQTVDYFTTTTGNAYTIIDPANSDKLHFRKGDKIIFTASTLPDSVRFSDAHRGQFHITDYVRNKFNDLDLVVMEATKDSPSPSISYNSDRTFDVINFGDRIDFQWPRMGWDPWVLKIWQCPDQTCATKNLLKEDNQNDYFQNSDYITADGTKKNLYFSAASYTPQGKIIKDFGVIKVQAYEQK